MYSRQSIVYIYLTKFATVSQSCLSILYLIWKLFGCKRKELDQSSTAAQILLCSGSRVNFGKEIEYKHDTYKNKHILVTFHDVATICKSVNCFFSLFFLFPIFTTLLNVWRFLGVLKPALLSSGPMYQFNQLLQSIATLKAKITRKHTHTLQLQLRMNKFCT